MRSLRARILRILMGGLFFYPGVRDPEREPVPSGVADATEPTATSGVRNS